MPVYEKCKVFTCSYTCNLHVIIDSVFLPFLKYDFGDKLSYVSKIPRIKLSSLLKSVHAENYRALHLLVEIFVEQLNNQTTERR